MTPVLMKRLAGYVESASAAANGQMVGGRAVLVGMHFTDTSGGSAGAVVLKDGGSGGTNKVSVHTPGKGEGDDVTVPRGGMVFENGIYVELTNVDGLTIFYQR